LFAKNEVWFAQKPLISSPARDLARPEYFDKS
jgi:hypothetical protein